MTFPYKISRIPKGNGKFRQIYIPSNEYKAELRALIPGLERILDRLDTHRLNYAFQKGRNCVLNALQHAGYGYTLSMDIEDFFNSIHAGHLSGLITAEHMDRCLIDGNPKQGLPTSPLIATIAFLRCDSEIYHALNKLKIRFSYTRYADDLIVSFDDRHHLTAISFIIKQAVARHGFRINPAKTRLQSSKNGRRVITGVALANEGPCATRRTNRKLRAAQHQANAASLRGLREWSSCKLPRAMFVED